MLSILPLPLSLIVPTIRIESRVFNGIAHVKAGVSRYYYGLKFVKENVSKQVEKMVEKCQGLLQKSSAKTQHTLLLFPIFENLSYGATWPRLLLGVWSCGHHWLKSSLRRLAAEEGSFSKKTWLLKINRSLELLGHASFWRCDPVAELSVMEQKKPLYPMGF